MAYITSGAIEQKFGVTTVLKWADLDNDGVADSGRVAAAIGFADAEIDGLLRATHYRKPFVTSAGGVPSIIQDISAALAGCWLKDARGQDTFDEHGAPVDSLSWHRTRAYQQIEQIKTGAIRLDAL